MEENKLERDIENYKPIFPPLNLNIPVDQTDRFEGLLQASDLKTVLVAEARKSIRLDAPPQKKQLGGATEPFVRIGILAPFEFERIEKYRCTLLGATDERNPRYGDVTKGYSLATDAYARFMGADFEYPDLPLDGHWILLPSPPIDDSA